MSKSNTSDNAEINKEEAIPDEFTKVIYDLVNDILFAFPEFKEKLDLDLHNIKETRDEDSIRNVYEHVKKYIQNDFLTFYTKMEKFLVKKT